jgi:signal transduction histidine kinase
MAQTRATTRIISRVLQARTFGAELAGRLPRDASPGGAERRLRLGARWLTFTLLALVATFTAAVLLLRPPGEHLKQLVFALACAGIGALALGEAALRLTGAARLGSVRLKLAIPPLLTALVIALTVLALARVMFLSPEDSTLLLVFLCFAVLVAVMLADTLASALAGSIARIETGARRIAEGDYAFRVPQDAATADELSRLARWFNVMAESVESAFAQRERVEAERRRVLAALSHDLRTPLASIRAMIEAIDDGVVTEDTTVRRYQRAIRGEVRRLGQLLDDLFQLSRLESGAQTLQLERLDIEDLISDALEAFHEQAERGGVRLEGGVDGHLPTIAVDPREIARVLANLLQNALRYTPGGGAVVVRATRMTGPQAGSEILVRVLDSGVGVAAADLPQIFERAYRGDAARVRRAADDEDGIDARDAVSGSGAGLGLAIARGIVELHGGRMWAISPLPAELRAQVAPCQTRADDCAGTAICFTLPVRPI